jgi:hypothetical protein
VSDSYPPKVRRTEVAGVAVVKDEPLPSGLSKRGALVPLTGTRQLTLFDGRVLFGCNDCEMTGTRGEVQSHRAREHGGESAEPARPQARNRTGLSDDTLSMQLRELLELASQVEHWQDIFEGIRRERDLALAQVAELKNKLVAEQRDHRKLQQKIKRLVDE